MGDKPGRVTRRQMLLGAGAATMAVGLTTLGSGRARAAARAWTHEADVVIVGTGIGGSTAAVVAREHGNDVVLLDKAVIFGGTSAKTAAVLWIPNNFTLREKGIEDRRQDCLEYMARFSYPQHFNAASPMLGVGAAAFALLEAFYDNAAAATDFLRAKGVLELAEWRMFALDHSATDYLDRVPENRVPQGRALGIIKEGGGLGLGIDMMAQMEQAVKTRAIPVLLGHRATRLVRNDAGRVIGIEAEQDGRQVAVGARKAVIFGTGGYAHNPDLIADYQRARVYGSCAFPTSTGDFLRIAAAAGARLGNLSGAWRTQVVLEEALASPVMPGGVFLPPGDAAFQVNKYGVRAVNESANYDDRAEAHARFDPVRVEFPNQLLFMIYDQRVAEAFAGMYPLPAQPTGAAYVLAAATLDGLVDQIEQRLAQIRPHIGAFALDPAFGQNLQATFARYNAFAHAGRDEDFHRGDSRYDREWKLAWGAMRTDTKWPPNEGPNVNLYPLRDAGPYYAIILGAGVLDTCGGPVIDATARVLDTEGAPIPGLYGVGNCIASPSREAYWGGGCPLGLSLTYGYIAANAAHLEPRTVV